MKVSRRAQQLAKAISGEGVKFGDLKQQAKEIKKDHGLALELWSTGQYHPRLLATLLFDKKLLNAGLLEQIAGDMLGHEETERNQLADWLLANQLMKDRKLVALMQTWSEHPSPMLRRLFWYHQARLRWMGRTPPSNTAELLEVLEKEMADAEPEVQWAMNFCAGWIGVHEPRFRSRCIELGKSTGLYKDEPVARNCTPSYLPKFIAIEAAKRE